MPKSALGSLETEELRAPLFYFVLGRVRNREVAEDLVQDILLKAAKNAHTLKARETLPAWLFRIARNRVADYFRAVRDTEEFDESRHGGGMARPDYPEREESALRERLNAYIRSVVDGLPPLYRNALVATEYEGLPQADLARREGISVSAAKSRVQRARVMLREEMERCCRWEADKYGQVLDVTPRQPSCSCDEEAR